MLILIFWSLENNTKPKQDYNKVTGRIEYLENEYQQWPTRHKGDFRYLIVHNYPYTFEIYLPNSKPIDKSLDDLVVGDTVDIYYYENEYFKDDSLNRFTQFIDKKFEPYFIRNGFQEQLAYFIIALFLFINFIGFLLWRKGKFPLL